MAKGSSQNDRIPNESANSDRFANSPHIFPGRDRYAKEAHRHYAMYEAGIRALMVSYGMISDAECMLARPLHWHPMVHDHRKARKAIIFRMQALLVEAREGFLRVCQDAQLRSLDEKIVVASVFREVAYRDNRARSFALVVSDVFSAHRVTLSRGGVCPAMDTSSIHVLSIALPIVYHD